MGKPKRKRTTASEKGEVDLNAKCEVCASADYEQVDMISCDYCDKAYHLDCLHPPLDKPPAGTWECPECRTRIGSARGHTFLWTKGPKVSKEARRQEAGLTGDQPLTEEEFYGLLEHGLAPSTRARYAATVQRYEEDCWARGRVKEEAVSLGMWLMEGVRKGKAYETLRRDAVAVKRSMPRWGKEAENLLQQTLRVCYRLANVPKGDKLPLTLEQMHELRRTISRWKSKRVGRELSERIRLRDWTFFLLGFVGFFRGSELVHLQWKHLRFTWARQGRREETVKPSPPAGFQDTDLAELTVFVVESKTDQGGDG